MSGWLVGQPKETPDQLGEQSLNLSRMIVKPEASLAVPVREMGVVRALIVESGIAATSSLCVYLMWSLTLVSSCPGMRNDIHSDLSCGESGNGDGERPLCQQSL